MFAPGSQPHPGAKTESCEQERDARKFEREKIERGADILPFAKSAIVYTGAAASAAKIETQHRDAKGIERFRRLVDHLVVHGAAKERMRMADDRSERRMLNAGWFPEDRFEASCRSWQKEITGIVRRGHRCAKENFSV